MRGRRTLAEKHAAHALEAPVNQAAIHALLTSQLPDRDRALVGRDAILSFLGSSLGLTRPSGRPVTWRMVLRWARDDSFPLLHGAWRPQYRTPCLTTTFACTAWTLSRLDTDQHRLFRVHSPAEHSVPG